MESQLKQRLVGIAVIVSLAVIFLPMILDGAGVVGTEKNQFEAVGIEVPPAPTIERRTVDLNPQVQQMNKRINEMPKPPNSVVDEQNKVQIKAQEKTTSSASVSKKSSAKAVTKLGGDSWIAQLGSFKDQDKAFKLQDKVRAFKIAPVFIQKIMLQKGFSYRVRLGPFLYKKQAKAAAEKLNNKYTLKSVVMKHEK